MNDVIEVLRCYFNNNDIDKLLSNISIKKRTTIINDNYFAKLCIRDNSDFCNSFIREMKLYNDNKSNNEFPTIESSLINDDYCLLILQKINAKTIGDNRNEFNLGLSNQKRKLIINRVLDIKNISVNFELDNSYQRSSKIDNYLLKAKKYISTYTYNKIISLKNIIINERYNRVLSHGDLISTNIIINNNDVYFLDWEYISLKPLYYDLSYFLLFSKVNNCFDILNSDEYSFIDIQDVYKDGIIICLKEIVNNSKLYGCIDNKIIDKNIKRWNKELCKILRKLKKNE